MGFFSSNIGVPHQPSIDHVSLIPPLVAYFESRDLSLGYQSINSEFVYFKIAGNLFSG